MGTSSKQIAANLAKLASRQHGCFSAAQAIRVGYKDSVHPYHVKKGNWLRLYRGVYQLASTPTTPQSRCTAALLWSRDNQGEIQAILAPETEILMKKGELSEKMPIKLLIPRSFRRSAAIPKGIEVDFIPDSVDAPLPASDDRSTSPSAISKEIAESSPKSDHFGSMADYYDWLDFQRSKCKKNT